MIRSQLIEQKHHKTLPIMPDFKKLAKKKNIPFNEQSQETGVFMTDFQIEEYLKKPIDKKRKYKESYQQNLFDRYGTKEFWDKVNEIAKNNQTTQPLRFPDIGIEKTPIYQLQMEEMKKNKKNKNEFLQKLMNGEYNKIPKHNKFVFNRTLNMRINSLKSYKSRIEIQDPINKNLLSHKLARAMQAASVLWGTPNRGRTQQEASIEPTIDTFI